MGITLWTGALRWQICLDKASQLHYNCIAVRTWAQQVLLIRALESNAPMGVQTPLLVAPPTLLITKRRGGSLLYYLFLSLLEASIAREDSIPDTKLDLTIPKIPNQECKMFGWGGFTFIYIVEGGTIVVRN